MPDGIAGDQSPPGDRIGPTFRDIYSYMGDVVRVGTRACYMSTEAPWLLDIGSVDERARSRKRTNKTSGEIESKDREIAACELLGAIADAVFPENEKEGSIAIGEAKGYRYAPLERRSAVAARLRGLESESSGKHWRQHHGKRLQRLMADVVFRLIYAPDTVDDIALGKGEGIPQ